MHVGQTEDVAGQGAGKQFKKAGAKKVLIVIHEASNSGLQQRADGVKKILGGAGVKVLTIPNAKSDIPGTKAKVQAAFKADKTLDGFLGLDPDVTIPCLDVVPKGTKVGTFDVGGSIKEIQAGRMLFAIDQQQYLQGYLPVVFAMLYVTNLNTVGNGAAGADRPRDHQQGERGAGRRARREGHALGRERAGGAAAARPDAGRAMAESSSRRPDPDERLVRVSPLAALLTRPDIGAFDRRGRRLASRSATSPAPSTGSATRGSRPAGPTRPRSTGSSRCRSRC